MKKNKTIPSLTKYIVFSITIVIVYSVIEFIFSITANTSHDVLTGCVYGFFGGEIVTCGLIKIFKLKGGGNQV